MLRIAVPNKGALSDTAVQMLHEAGYATRRDQKELTVSDPRNDVEFFYLRPRDIATYVGSGALDVGVTGRDLLLDSGSPAREAQGWNSTQDICTAHTTLAGSTTHSSSAVRPLGKVTCAVCTHGGAPFGSRFW